MEVIENHQAVRQKKNGNGKKECKTEEGCFYLETCVLVRRQKILSINGEVWITYTDVRFIN